jgi:hypothetical protein
MRAATLFGLARSAILAGMSRSPKLQIFFIFNSVCKISDILYFAGDEPTVLGEKSSKIFCRHQ